MRITSPRLARIVPSLAFAVQVMNSACSTEGVTRASELDAAAADSGESGASTDSGAGEPGESIR